MLRDIYRWLTGHKEGVILATGTLAALLLRFFSARDNLWFDEVWTMNFISSMRSVFDVFATTHDNNHILNTVYLYYFGSGSWWPKYRLLSILSGTAVVPMIGYIGFRRNFSSGLIATVLMAFSAPLIILSSEARGYAPAMMFAGLSFLAIQNSGKEKTAWTITFWISSILGILSHLTFVYIFAGLALSSFWGLLKKNFYGLKKVLVLYSVPAAFLILFYFGFIRFLKLGGGVYYPPGLARFSEFALPVLSLPRDNPLFILLALAVFFAVFGWILRKEIKNEMGLFFLLVLLVVPFWAYFSKLEFFGFRYLALSAPFLYLILAFILAWIANLSNFGKIICILLTSLIVICQSGPIAKQILTGRGDYLGALEYIYANTDKPVISLMSDDILRNQILLDFYNQFIPDRKEIVYLYPKDSQKRMPDWFLMHSLNPKISTMAELLDNQGYKLRKISDYADFLSGWAWFIYKKE